MRFLFVLLFSSRVFGSPTSFFDDLCELKDYSITNPYLPESLGDRSSCSLKVYEDGTYKNFSLSVRIAPCDALQYSIPLGSFHAEAATKCSNEVYKLVQTPFKDEKGSIIYFSTMSDESEPSYMVAAFCKRGKATGRYAEITESLSDEELNDLRNIYGIKITADEINKCLEDAGACS